MHLTDLNSSVTIPIGYLTGEIGLGVVYGKRYFQVWPLLRNGEFK